MSGDATTLWARIGEALQAERARITREIAEYPTPIAGCDQQFNHLLELQAGYPGEWARYEEARHASRNGDDPGEAARAFLASSRYLPAAVRDRLLR